jgi:hypothetical protein
VRSQVANAVLLCLTVAAISGCYGQAILAQNEVGFTTRVSADLLYISDDQYLYVYTYPGVAYVDKLEILGGLGGLCADSAGDIFIARRDVYGRGEIDEYAHGGYKPIATLFDPNASPLGCSVDSGTGNLAVTSYAGDGPSQSGSLAIYQGAQGDPNTYTDPDLFFYDFCTYDDKGNLFVDGQDAYLNPVVAELPKGRSKLTNLTLRNLPKSFGYPGGILWDGRYLAFGDIDRSVIYRLRVSGSTAAVVSSTKLANGQSVEEFTISDYGRRMHGAMLIGPNSADRSVMFWSYPAGGQPTKSITGLDGSFGTVISKGRE